MSEKQREIGPTNRSIGTLFRELTSHHQWPQDMEYRRLQAEITALEDRLLQVPELQELKRRLDQACLLAQGEERRKAKKIETVRRRYLAKGLTPAVKRDIEKLIEELEG